MEKKYTPVKSVRGTQDIYPEQYYRRLKAFEKLRNVFERYGYQGIDVPLIEPVELHLRKSGDKILKGMYHFKDYGDRDICLRPEITASVVRAFNEGLANEKRPVKLYYHGAVFRYDKPQEGRYRQFTQTGVEVIGTSALEYDAEMIKMTSECMESLGIQNYEVAISDVSILFALLDAIGLPQEKKSLIIGYLEDLNKVPDKNDFIPIIKKGLAESGVAESEINAEDGPYSKVVKLILELSNLRGTPPEVFDRLHETMSHFINAGDPLPDTSSLKKVCDILISFGINWNKARVDFGFGRGLAYYTGTVFEIYSPLLGAANQVCGGGRYDELLNILGGHGEAKSVGFAFGFERLILAAEREKNAKAQGDANLEKGYLDAYVIPMSESDFPYAIKVASILRNEGAKVEIDFSGRHSSKATKRANSTGAKFVVYVGGDEEKKNGFTLKDMKSGAQEFCELDKVKDSSLFGSRS